MLKYKYRAVVNCWLCGISHEAAVSLSGLSLSDVIKIYNEQGSLFNTWYERNKP